MRIGLDKQKQQVTSGSTPMDLAGVRRRLGFLSSSEKGEEEIELKQKGNQDLK